MNELIAHIVGVVVVEMDELLWLKFVTSGIFCSLTLLIHVQFQ